MTKSRIIHYINEYRIHSSFELQEILDRMENSLEYATNPERVADLKQRMSAIKQLIEEDKRRCLGGGSNA